MATQALRPFVPVTKAPLTEADYANAAAMLGINVPALKAVAAVESNGSGFRPDGYPTLLLEGHHFSRFTRGRYDESHPHLSYPQWTKKFYGKNWQLEQDRFVEAAELNRSAAQLSTSYGAFQIMGFNFGLTDCDSINEFCLKMGNSSADQLDLACRFMRSAGLVDELQRKDWRGFARGYNGPGYESNAYHIKLPAAYARFGGI
jgi:hypothetical protein